MANINPGNVVDSILVGVQYILRTDLKQCFSVHPTAVFQMDGSPLEELPGLIPPLVIRAQRGGRGYTRRGEEPTQLLCHSKYKNCL